MPEKDPTLWSDIAASLAAILGVLTMWAWKRTHILLDSKASASSVDILVQRLEKTIDAHTRFVEKAIEELGKRPTRDECVTMHRRITDQ